MRSIIRSRSSLIALIASLAFCLGLAQQVQGNLAAHRAAMLAARAMQDAATDEAEMFEDAYFESAADHDGLRPRQYLIEPRYPDIVPRSFQPRFPPTRSLHSPIRYAYPQLMEQDPDRQDV